MIKKTAMATKAGFTLIEVIVTIVVAAILAALLVNFMGPNLIGSSTSGVRAYDHYKLIEVVEKINIDYNKLMNAGDTNALVTLQSHIQAGNVVGNVPYFGVYSQTTQFVTFVATADPTKYIEQPSGTATNTLKVTVTRNDQTITTIFTK